MGYCIKQNDTEFTLKAENKAKALEAIKALVDKYTIEDSGGRHFSWVRITDFLHTTTFEAAMLSWRWNCEVKNGDVVALYFNGEKHGDDDLLFKAIAPYVEAGSFIIMEGEDGAIWRWVFDGNICNEQHAAITIEWE